jgi:hypothetical protein
MSKVLRLVNGIPRYQDAVNTVMNEQLSVGGTIVAGTNVTIPNSGNYTGAELEIYLNGQRLNVVEDFNYVGSPPRTQVTFVFNLIAGDLVVFRSES